VTTLPDPINQPASLARPVVHRTYSSLVQGDVDLIGHIAYALYKRDKLKFCEQHQAATGNPPTTPELDIFIRGCNLDTRLSGYRSEAEILLERFAEFQLEEAVAQLQNDYNEKLLTKLQEGKSWTRVIGEALVGNFAVALLWAALILAFYVNKVGSDRVIKEVTSLDVKSGSPSVVVPDTAASAAK
jgi:hypothetical protein